MTVSRSNQPKETPDEGNEKVIIIVSILSSSLQSHHGEIISKRKIYRRPFKFVIIIFPCVLLPF